MNKDPLSNLYQQIILSESEKNSLQNPGSDEVGNFKTKQDLFGAKPKPVEGPEKAKLDKGPSYKETTGTTSAPKKSNSSMPKSSPGKEPSVSKGKEMEDTDVDPTDHEDESDEEQPTKKKKVTEENYSMSAFENLFRKKIIEEEMEEDLVGSGPDEALGLDDEGADTEGMEDELEEEEGDLLSDLRSLSDKLAEIIGKLEGIESEEEGLEGGEGEEGEEYSDEDFDNEFGEDDEEPVKESMEKPKPLGDKKKVLQHKKNKVGKLSAKGGKAHAGSLKHEPKPKALGDKKGSLQKGKPEVRSSLKKGDFIK